MFILLTNDDGIFARGLRCMYKELVGAGHEVTVIAPLGEQSAVGHSITVLTPLRVKEVKESGFHGFAVNGTPTDCVKLGLSNLVERRPDLVVSGINAGANVGPDILYSGTVAAATEAAAMGLNTLAVSHNSFLHENLEPYAAFAAGMVAKIPWSKVPPKRVMNLNLPRVPAEEFRGLALCPQTDAAWNDWYHERVDPRGNKYWWMDGEIPAQNVRPGTDKHQLDLGWATLTPLKFEFTDREFLAELKGCLDADFFV